MLTLPEHHATFLYTRLVQTLLLTLFIQFFYPITNYYYIHLHFAKILLNEHGMVWYTCTHININSEYTCLCRNAVCVQTVCFRARVRLMKASIVLAIASGFNFH